MKYNIAGTIEVHDMDPDAEKVFIAELAKGGLVEMDVPALYELIEFELEANAAVIS